MIYQLTIEWTGPYNKLYYPSSQPAPVPIYNFFAALYYNLPYLYQSYAINTLFGRAINPGVLFGNSPYTQRFLYSTLELAETSYLATNTYPNDYFLDKAGFDAYIADNGIIRGTPIITELTNYSLLRPVDYPSISSADQALYVAANGSPP